MQIEIWLLLAAYKKSPASYPMVLSLTSYDLPFSHRRQLQTTTDDTLDNSAKDAYSMQ